MATTRIESRQVGDRTFQVVIAEANGAFAEIWPEVGGNCARWFHPKAGEILFAPTINELIERPTRGGIPILFPFPNRIRDGRFTWAGRNYQLPKNDSAGVNAIHGFTPRSTFEIHAHGGDEKGCFIWLRHTGHECLDDLRSKWPTDWLLDWTWILRESGLDASIVVQNTDDHPLPFGLGLHPYFRLTSQNDCITLPAEARWELQEGLPTGRIVQVSEASDLRTPKHVSSLTLDDVYTQVESISHQGWRTLGTFAKSDNWSIEIKATSQFREVVVFTPPHRQAICIEPYTCPTDAVNLQVRNNNTGWQVLNPSKSWMAGVSMSISQSA